MIRRLTEADREIFLWLSEEFYGSDAVLHPIPDSYHAAAFDEMMRSDVYADGFLIYNKDEIAGYAMTAKTYSHEAGGLTVWIEELYLLPEHRGQGLGHAFFAFAEEFYKGALCRMRLETEPENERAEALYRSLGFEELGYRPFVKEFTK
ncbi:MAG: GNAT family N-acetyltransferase [Clostridia bacterium]|nr:GNAT family N-acetyltransferase [Clostridia bacterium]